MSVTVSKADGVTVLTLTSDPQSPWPPLCQILGGLCYSPVCCTVSQHLRSLNSTSQTVLGILQIFVGLLNIGLGAIFLNTYSPNLILMYYIGFPFWLGTLFILFGIMCILSEKYPSVCLVVLTVALNVAAVAFAIAAIVLYGLSFERTLYPLEGVNCDTHYNNYGYEQHVTSSLSSEERIIQEKCWEGKAVVEMLLRSMSIMMVVVSALQLCVVISSMVLGMKALQSIEKEENKSADDPELYKPLLEEVPAQPGA